MSGADPGAKLKAGERRFSMVVDPVKEGLCEASGAVHVLTDIQELAQANRAKGESLAMLGHELRNPLAPLLNAVTVPCAEGPTTAALERAGEQVRHLVRLVDDQLDVSRINRGTIDLRRSTVDMSPIVRQAVPNARPLMDVREHLLQAMVPDEDVGVHADATRVEPVFANLLTNARKQTPGGGQVTVCCTALDAQVRISGRGIPTAMRSHVFDLLTRVSPSLDRSQGGLGLGLTRVRRLVAMHGGSVSAHSEGEGFGAEFAVLLPITTDLPAAEEKGPGTSGDYGRASKRVLIVEDNPNSRDTLCDLIQLWGYDVAVAPDGLAGFDILPDFRPDVALIDIGLPGIDGYELARQVRATEGGGRVTLVALTGYGQPDDRRRAFNAGFDDHLVKPLDPEKLRRLLIEL